MAQINFSAPEPQWCEIDGKKVEYNKCTLVYENVRGYDYLGSSLIHYVKGEKIQRNQLLHFYKRLS